MKNNRIQMEDLLDPWLMQGCRIFSVVGSGGKTTLIRRAALHYAACMYVGVATSTRMYLPDDQWQYGGAIPPVLLPDQWKPMVDGPPPICFYAEHLLPEGKIWDIGEEMLALAMEKSDLLLIESDGSNRKPLKGWRADEPVILPQTEVTIGVLPMHCLGQIIDDDMVHRMALFTTITGLKIGDRMSIEAYIRLVTHVNGLFGHARGKRVLVFNRADCEERKKAATRIAEAVCSCIDAWTAGCLEDD